MEISRAPAPAQDAYGRMRRLSAAIDDPDSSFGERRRWTSEYVELNGELVGSVGARTAGGAVLLDRATRHREQPDGHVPRLGRPGSSTDVYL